MKNWKIYLLVIFTLLIPVVFFSALMIGRYTISFDDFFQALFTNSSSTKLERNVIINLRIPRTIVAALTGISLSLSGFLYQEIFRNKLTSPDLLGVSNGAGFGASLSILLSLPSALISIFSFLFGLITVVITIVLSKLFKTKTNISLILSGVIVASFMSSLLSLSKYMAVDDAQLSTITFWLMGSFERIDFNDVYIISPVVIICTILIFIFRWRINIVSLGREEAISKGINYSFYKYFIIIIATLLTAISVGFCGSISWVGLIIPHLVRLICGKETSKNIPFCIVFGAIFMILVDIFSRSFTSQEIPVSAITGIFGAVIFVVTIIVKKGKKYVY